MVEPSKNRPRGITALSVFFFIGAVISFTASVSLLLPASLIEPMWRLNPCAHTSLARIGAWAIILLVTVSVCCLITAVGLWRGARWGQRLAVILITVNLVASAINGLSGTEPRALIGVPIAAVIVWYLFSTPVRIFFYRSSNV